MMIICVLICSILLVPLTTAIHPKHGAPLTPVDGRGIFPNLAPNVSVLPQPFVAPSEGPFFDVASLLRDQDSDLISKVRKGNGSTTPPTLKSRDYSPPLKPLHVTMGDGTEFGFDESPSRPDFGDHCFALDSCKRCSPDEHCGWCAVEATCYTVNFESSCEGGWTTTKSGTCPPEASVAVPLPAMVIDTNASHVPFELDNLDDCVGSEFSLPGDCQKSKLLKMGGTLVSNVKFPPHLRGTAAADHAAQVRTQKALAMARLSPGAPSASGGVSGAGFDDAGLCNWFASMQWMEFHLELIAVSNYIFISAAGSEIC